MRPIELAIIVFLSFIMGMGLGSRMAQAHDWYPLECCSGMDCQQVPVETVEALSDGYHVTLKADDHMMLLRPTSYVVPYSDRRIKPSPDNEYHACISRQYEKHGGVLLCLFVKHMGY